MYYVNYVDYLKIGYRKQQLITANHAAFFSAGARSVKFHNTHRQAYTSHLNIKAQDMVEFKPVKDHVQIIRECESVIDQNGNLPGQNATFGASICVRDSIHWWNQSEPGELYQGSLNEQAHWVQSGSILSKKSWHWLMQTKTLQYKLEYIAL